MECFINRQPVVIGRPSGRFHIALNLPTNELFFICSHLFISLSLAGLYFPMKVSVVYRLHKGDRGLSHLMLHSVCGETPQRAARPQYADLHHATRPQPSPRPLRRPDGLLGWTFAELRCPLLYMRVSCTTAGGEKVKLEVKRSHAVHRRGPDVCVAVRVCQSRPEERLVVEVTYSRRLLVFGCPWWKSTRSN